MCSPRGYGINGRQAEAALRAAHLTCNRNVIPNDPNGAWYTSGVRLGTPAVSTLGMGMDEMREIAQIIHTVLSATKPGSSPAKCVTEPSVLAAAHERVSDLLERFPLYPQLDL